MVRPRRAGPAAVVSVLTLLALLGTLAACADADPVTDAAAAPPPEPAPRTMPDPGPPEPPEPAPIGWPDPLIVGVFPTEVDPDALARLGARLSDRLPVRVRTAVLRDSASLASSLAADRIAVALLDPVDAVGVGVSLDGLPQAVRAAGRGRVTVWVGVDPTRWCLQGAGAELDGAPRALALTGCSGLATVPPAAGVEVASPSALAPDTRVFVVEEAGPALVTYGGWPGGLGTRDAGDVLGDEDAPAAEDQPGADAEPSTPAVVSLEIARRELADDPGTLVVLPLDLVGALAGTDEGPLVVVGWGPTLPNPMLVPGPGLPAEVWEAFATALVEVVGTPHGAEALLDTLGIEGWAPVDGAVLDLARALAGVREADSGPAVVD
jgi:ABC-type phosphate/phosphonate transport system substrate-binding protein